MNDFALLCSILLVGLLVVLGVDYVRETLERRRAAVEFRRDLEVMWQNRRENDDA